MHHSPTLPYKGLTIVLDRPSRFDHKQLISGNAGDYFNAILAPFTRFHCDIRLASDTSDFLPGTKVVLLLGQQSLEKYKPSAALQTYRGSPLTTRNTDGSEIILIPTFTPQDSLDRKNYENPDDEEDSETGEDKESEKDYQKTSRKNYRFWMHADVKKAIRICQTGIRIYPHILTKLCPVPSELIQSLSNYENGFLSVDIECDENQNLTCFAVMWSPTANINELTDNQLTCYVIPFKRYTGSIFYSQLDYVHILRALTVAFSKNTVIGHNLQFDLFVLLFKYFINPPLAPYCTMVAHHRIHPEVEKSLGHAVSYYTDLPYHKDEGIYDPKNAEQEQSLWKYNAKDVITTFFIYCVQQKELILNDAVASAKQAMRTMRSLLAMQYEGCLADTDLLCKTVDEADQRMEQYARILKLLTKRDFNPRSSQQVCHYLYTELRLPKPAINPTKEENLLKLYARYQIPSLRVILAYRGEGKQASTLRKIRLWRGNRITCAYAITGTNTFRLNSKALLNFKGSTAKKAKI